MTFSTRLKEEISSLNSSRIVIESELSAIIRYDAKISKKSISLSFENGAVARKVYKNLKLVFKVPIQVIIRNQKRLRTKQIYILEIHEKIKEILQTLHIYKNGRYKAIEREYLADKEQVMGFIRGVFLANGSINDPSTSGYHLEFVYISYKDAQFLNKLLKELKFHSKVLKRNNRYMVYLKSSEEISDIIRFFEAINSLFYFEDIRIYRDHKNMLNRLNNCDIANQEKIMKTANIQLEQIAFLKKNNLFSLLDEKTQLVMNLREKHKESSFQELADIITNKYGYKISKSGINHHFIKVKKLIENYQKTK